jgi:cytosine/adenosine deaminase-related metal-dependent hydrolase
VALAMDGMTPREVLRAATIDVAHIIGLDQDLGTVDFGKLADLVVLDKNPLESIRNTNTIRYVMKNGEPFEGDSPIKSDKGVALRAYKFQRKFAHSGSSSRSICLGFLVRGFINTVT